MRERPDTPQMLRRLDPDTPRPLRRLSITSKILNSEDGSAQEHPAALASLRGLSIPLGPRNTERFADSKQNPEDAPRRIVRKRRRQRFHILELLPLLVLGPWKLSFCVERPHIPPLLFCSFQFDFCWSQILILLIRYCFLIPHLSTLRGGIVQPSVVALVAKKASRIPGC